MRRARIIIVVISLFLAFGLVFVSMALASPAAGVSPVVETPQAGPEAEEAKSQAAEQQTGGREAQAIQALAAADDGPLFVGLDDITVPAFRIDVLKNTFSEAFVGAEVWGAAYDADNDRVLFSSGVELYEWVVDGPINFMGTVSDTMSVFVAMEGLAYYNGTLYASKAGSTGEGEGIYTVDLTTRQATRVIAYSDPTQTTISGIDADSVTGQLYGVNDATALRGLVRIDPDGTVTVISDYQAGETDVDGLAVGGGKAYLITDDPTPPEFAVFDFDTLTYTLAVSSPFTTTEVFAAGAWIAPPARPSYCMQPTLAIPDNTPAGVTSDLIIHDTATIEDLDIRLDVSHTWVGDLIVGLEHIETGTSLTFVDRPGVPDSVAGCSGNNVAAFINDEGLSGNVESTCSAGTPTIAGNLVGGDPANDNLLAAFDGEDLSGTWRLTISDNNAADVGTLDQWCLSPLIAGPEIVASPGTLSSVQARNTQVTQTLTISNVGGANLDWSIGELPAAAPAQTGQPPAALAPRPVSAPVVSSAAQCESYENYAGAEPEGYAQFCLGLDPQALEKTVSVSGSAGGGFAHDVGFVSDNVVEFSLDDFPGQTVRSSNNEAIYGYDYDSTGTTLYALHNTNQQLGTFDPATGVFTAIGSSLPKVGQTWSGLAIDPTNNVIYASGTGGITSTLYTLDATTGAATPVGDIPGAGLVIDIAMNPEGELYAHDIGTDSIYRLDPATGAPTLIGPTGYDANFAQGMDFDNSNGTLYIFLYMGGGANVFGTVDLTTGAVTPLAQDNPAGEFEGATRTLVPCTVDLPWVSTDPVSGTIPGGSSMNVLVTFDSTGLSPDDYTGSLCVDSTDISDPRITVPVTLTVSNASPVAVADTYHTTPATTLMVPAPGVLDNDSDADGDPITAVLDAAPSNGTLMLNADGSFSYTPNMGFEGQDSFTYHANDGFADSNTVTVQVATGPQITYLPIVIKEDSQVQAITDDTSAAANHPWRLAGLLAFPLLLGLLFRFRY